MKSKKSRLKLEKAKERINPQYTNKPLRCGRHCRFFWSIKGYFSSHCDDYGCKALTEEEFMMKWDWTLDFAIFCPYFKKKKTSQQPAYITRQKKDRKWLLKLLYKRSQSDFFNEYCEENTES